MKKILIAVDRTEGSLSVLSVLKNQIRKPQDYILLHVQSILGGSLMSAMMGKAEMATLKQAYEGTLHHEALMAESEQILSYYQRKLTDFGLPGGRCVVTSGHPADEILKVAREKKVDLILGSNPKTLLERILSGSVSREVQRRASMPVLIAKPHVAGGKQRWEASLDFWEAYNLRREKLKMGFDCPATFEGVARR
jgi:nucleotide-binding universal stress UspA family protein